MDQQHSPLPSERTEVDEATWIALSRTGDQAAFSRLVTHYQRPIYNLCYRMLPDAMTAEDAAQEVFLRAFLKLDSYNDAYKFSTWLFAIATHYCLDWIKHRRLQLISWDDIAPEQHVVINPMLQPETSLLKTEEAQAVQSLIQTLNPDYRALVILKYWSDLTYDEIGLIYGLTTSAVKSKLFRARRALARAAHRPQSASDPRSRSPLPVPV